MCAIIFMHETLCFSDLPVALLTCSAGLLQRMLSLNCLIEPCTNLESNCSAQGPHAWLGHMGGAGGLGGSDAAGPALRPCVRQGAPWHVRYWGFPTWKARAPAAAMPSGNPYLKV